MKRIAVPPVEILVSVALVALMVILSTVYRLRISLPTGPAAIAFAAHLALPLLAIGIWGIWEVRAGRRPLLRRRVVAVGCYAVVMIVHFNLKLWVPFVRSVSYDAILWRIDQWAFPLVHLCMALSAWLSPLFGEDGGAYLGALAVMFYLSFGYHACRTPEVIGRLFLSALILQALGAVAYFILPAVGPFLYQHGTTPALTGAQHNMLAAHQMALAMGPRWLIDHGDVTLFGGLGAMPSLHAAGSYLFVWFAWRHGRILLPTFLPLFAYILVTAVASRWHYLVDLPAGIALARLSIALAWRLDQPVYAAAAGDRWSPIAVAHRFGRWPSLAGATGGAAMRGEPALLTASAAS